MDSTDYGTSSTCESPLFLGEFFFINEKNKIKYIYIFVAQIPCCLGKKFAKYEGKNKMVLTHFNSDFSSVASFKQVFRDYLTLRSVSFINK